MNIRQLFLLVTAVGLTPIALSYGLMPQKSLGSLFDITVSNTNGIHVFRAIMGLYLGLISFWIIGAFKVHLRQPALYSLIVFMLGLAAGRILSFVVDGAPHWLLSVYMVLELALGIVGLLILKRPD